MPAMALPHEKLATSLEILHKLQGAGRRVFRSAALSRVHRERLIAGGFLQPIVRGWVMSSDPAADPGDTTPWFSSFWEFCAAYCDERFGDDWHLSADQSLMLHAGNTAVPRSEEHTSELQSLMRNSYAVFCLTKKKTY